MKGFTKQKGVAGIIFVSFLPILIITFSFSVGYTQRLLAHSKIEEAAEVASLALIASLVKTIKTTRTMRRELLIYTLLTTSAISRSAYPPKSVNTKMAVFNGIMSYHHLLTSPLSRLRSMTRGSHTTKLV